MIAYSYLRFSSKKQASGTSVKRQQQLINDYCLKHQLTLSDTTFEDLGVSAFRGNNGDAALGQFLEAVDDNKIPKGSYLLVESLDRLSRQQVQYALTQMLNIINAGVILVTLLDNQIYKTPVDTTQLMLSLAHMERGYNESMVKSQRISSAWEHKRSNNSKIATCPFWLDFDKETKQHTPNHYVETVKLIFDLYINGMGLVKLTQHINSLGKSPKGSLWGHTAINRVLQSRSVLGYFQHHVMDKDSKTKKRKPIGAEVKDYYPRIISDEVFMQAQSIRAKRSKINKGNTGGSTKSHMNVFHGSARCVCGQVMTVAVPRDQAYLVCKGKKLGTCENKMVNFKALKKFLIQVLCSPRYHNSWVSNSEQRQKKESQVIELQVKLSDKELNLQKLLEAAGDNLNAIVLQKVQDLSKSITELSEGISELKQGNVAEPHSQKLMSYLQTIELIEKAFEIGSNPEHIKARTHLKSILDNFSFTLQRFDEPLKYQIQMDGITYETLSDPNRKHSDTKTLWYVAGNDVKTATPEKAASIIKQFTL